MKKRLLIPIIISLIFSSCSDFSGNEDAVEASLKPGTTTTSTDDDDDETTTELFALKFMIILDFF